MTIQELYDFAKKNNVLNYELEAHHSDDDGFYYSGSRSINPNNIEVYDRAETVVI